MACVYEMELHTTYQGAANRNDETPPHVDVVKTDAQSTAHAAA